MSLKFVTSISPKHDLDETSVIGFNCNINSLAGKNWA